MIRVKQSADSATATMKNPRKTDGTKFFTPDQIGGRWGWHTESIRRLLRKGQIESVILGRRRLVRGDHQTGRVYPIAQVGLVTGQALQAAPLRAAHRRLVPISEVERIEAEGLISRTI